MSRGRRGAVALELYFQSEGDGLAALTAGHDVDPSAGLAPALLERATHLRSLAELARGVQEPIPPEWTWPHPWRGAGPGAYRQRLAT
jgi:hypothetical protein